MKQNREPRNKSSHTLSVAFFLRVPNYSVREKTVLSINGAGKTISTWKRMKFVMEETQNCVTLLAGC
jgi:hypothetical protein